MEYLYAVVAVLAAYLLGSLSFAVIVSRVMGLGDPRSYGSKNPGATNVLRSGSKKAAVLTLLLDALKGYVPVLLVKHFAGAWALGEPTLALVALAAFAGHLWPVFFQFKGGKGVATAAGVVFGIDTLLGLFALACFGLLVYFFRWVSLASVSSAALACFVYLLGDREFWYTSRPVLFALFVMAVILVVRHRENINRLFTGTEPKLGQKK